MIIFERMQYSTAGVQHSSTTSYSHSHSCKGSHKGSHNWLTWERGDLPGCDSFYLGTSSGSNQPSSRSCFHRVRDIG